jgi:triphosphoribosyl-dephospho-CoA synthase
LEAREIVELGGAETPAGRKKLREFDHELRQSGNLLNPGTTADLIAAALAVCVLDGYRP